MVEVLSVKETSYENDSFWLMYKQDEKYYGYELRYPKTIINPINEDKIHVSELKSEGLIYDVLYSDNEMLYIDEMDDKDYYDECKSLLEEDFKIYPKLAGYVEIEPYDDTSDTIVISGDIIVEVLFDKI